MKKIIRIGILLISSIVYSQVGINTECPNSTLTVNGSFAADYKIVTSDITLGITDYYVAYNGNTDGTITLPAAVGGNSSFKGRTYHIKNTSNYVLTILPSGTELIDGDTDLAKLTVPIGYYVELINKGAATSSTWELSMLINSTIPSMTSFINSYAIPVQTPATASTSSFNVSDVGFTVIPKSNSTFTLAVAKPMFINFTLGLDDYTPPSGGVSPYFKCEIYIDNQPSGFFQIIQEINIGQQLQFNISGVLNVPEGTHTIDARMTRWFNNSASVGYVQNFGTLSCVLSAVYLN